MLIFSAFSEDGEGGGGGETNQILLTSPQFVFVGKVVIRDNFCFQSVFKI